MQTSHSYSVETLHQLASTGNEFYEGLLHQFNQHGGLTAKQIACIAERPVTTAPRVEPALQGAAAGSIGHLERAFAHARSKGVHQPSIKLRGFRFMPADPAKARPENHEAIFVTSTDKQGSYLGKVLKARFLPSSLCTGGILGDVLNAIQDPFKAAVEYGLMTGECSVCSRTMTNPKSIQMGIGPVCRAKFGW